MESSVLLSLTMIFEAVKSFYQRKQWKGEREHLVYCSIVMIMTDDCLWGTQLYRMLLDKQLSEHMDGRVWTWVYTSGDIKWLQGPVRWAPLPIMPTLLHPLSMLQGRSDSTISQIHKLLGRICMIAWTVWYSPPCYSFWPSLGTMMYWLTDSQLGNRQGNRTCRL